jgi:protein-tyrosine-phosphatase
MKNKAQKQTIDLKEEDNINKTFIELFKLKIDALDDKIKNTSDSLVKVNHEIDKFYTEEEKIASERQIRITKIDSDKLIDRKVNRFKVILALCQNKYTILNSRIKDGFYTDSLDEAEAKIDLMKLYLEIVSKEEFLKRYEDRKNVYNK